MNFKIGDMVKLNSDNWEGMHREVNDFNTNNTPARVIAVNKETCKIRLTGGDSATFSIGILLLLSSRQDIRTMEDV